MRRAIALTLVLLAGCTLISGVGDLDAVDQSDSGALVNEAGSDVAFLPEASVDGSGSDAGRDAGDADATVPAKAFCQSVPANVDVCFDYDSVSYPAAPPPTQNGSTISAEGPGHDSTNSLRCVGADEKLVQCFHTIPLPANTTKVRYSFDLQVEQLGAGIEVGELQFAYTNDSKCALQPSVVGNKAYVNEYCPGVSEPEQINHEIATVDATGAANPWYSFDISVDLGTRTISGSLRSSNSKAAAVPFGPIGLNAKFVTSTMVELHAGLSFGYPNTPAAKVRVDNVTVDLH